MATSRAAAFAAFSHLATGLAPASYQSASLNRRGRISRQRLPEHRDALMNLPGLSQHCGVFIERHGELRARGLAGSRRGSPSPATPVGWPTRLLKTQHPFDEQRYRRARHQSERLRLRQLCRTTAKSSLPPARPGAPTAHTKASRSTASDQPAEPGPTAGPTTALHPTAGRVSRRPDDPCPLQVLTGEAKASRLRGQTRPATQLPLLTMVYGYSRTAAAVLIPWRTAEDLMAGWWQADRQAGGGAAGAGFGMVGRWRSGHSELTADCHALRGTLPTTATICRLADPGSTGWSSGCTSTSSWSFLPGRRCSPARRTPVPGSAPGRRW